MRFLLLILFENIIVGYRAIVFYNRMQFGYVVMIIMLSMTGMNCYNHRPFNPQKKKPIIASKRLKISKPYLPYKGPRSNLPYKCESTDSKTSKSKDKSDDIKSKEDRNLIEEYSQYLQTPKYNKDDNGDEEGQFFARAA